MKIAITGDVHLRNRSEYPERFNALENIFSQLLSSNIKTLIIAGDLFDAESQNYSEFDELCKQGKYKEIKLYIIPGNHDPTIKMQHFTSDNIQIFNEPKILQFGESSLNFLFLPYMHDKSMGEIIANYKEKLSDPWILIGHGDYTAGTREPNPYEPGTYMPLTRNDVEYLNPGKVILGHIHKKMDLGKVHYVGSPCGLDINETGRRSFLIIDTISLNVTSVNLDTDFIYFNETLITLPVTNEIEYIKNKLQEIIKKWDLSKSEIPKARIRLKVKGYTSDKNHLNSIIKKELKNFSFYKDEEPDLLEVRMFEEPECIHIIEKVKSEIEEMDLKDVNNFTNNEDILEEALHIILNQ